MKPTTDKPRVVLVDDDPDFQQILQGWLEPRYDPISLLSGQDLLQELEYLAPDMLILDVKLPGSDGFDLCRRIRSDARFRGLPILFLTGCRENADFFKNMEVGGTAYLTKPVRRTHLLKALQRVLQENLV